jgi:hypothetical protein
MPLKNFFHLFNFEAWSYRVIHIIAGVVLSQPGYLCVFRCEADLDPVGLDPDPASEGWLRPRFIYTSADPVRPLILLLYSNCPLGLLPACRPAYQGDYRYLLSKI